MIESYKRELEARHQQLERQETDLAAGRQPFGMWKARDTIKKLGEDWIEVKNAAAAQSRVSMAPRQRPSAAWHGHDARDTHTRTHAAPERDEPSGMCWCPRNDEPSGMLDPPCRPPPGDRDAANMDNARSSSVAPRFAPGAPVRPVRGEWRGG